MRRTPIRAAAQAAAVLAIVLAPVVGHVEDAAALPVRSVFNAGSAPDHGSTGTTQLNAPLVDIVRSATGGGYWLVAADGGVFSFGDAPFHGSTGNLKLNKPVVSIAPTPSGNGYWFVATDGGVFAFGDAGFFGSAGDLTLNQPVVGIAPTPTGRGYLLVASDGGVFAYGDARFSGSLGDDAPSAPVRALALAPDSRGYWLVDEDGQQYPFGDVELQGGSWSSDANASDIVSSPTGEGYWVLFNSGNVVPFGDAARIATSVDLGPGQAAVGLASTLDGTGLWIATSGRTAAPRTAGASGPHTFLQVDRAGRPGRWNPCVAEIPWWFNPANAPANGENFFREAFDYMSAITGLPFRYKGTTSDAPGTSRPGGMVVGWVHGLGGAAGVAPVAMTETSRGPRIVSSGVILEAGVRDLQARWGGGSWAEITLHELAHAVGMGHVDDGAQLMYPTTTGGADFGQGDLAGLHRLGASAGCL